ncbi:MAG: hypothetical protein J6X82_06845 [Bacteroidales bacterium]|nr:hypothetical protein [Bacteroidales bacterium]
MLPIFYIVVTALLSVLFLSMRDFPVVTGSILASGSGEKLYMKILIPLLAAGVIAFCGLRPAPSGEAVSAALSLPSVKLLLPVGIATLASVVLTLRISRFPAVQFAFIGAIAGLERAYGSGFGWDAASAYLISWIIAPLLCGALAALIYKIYVGIASRRSAHLIKRESLLLSLSVIASLLLVCAYSFNNAVLFCCMPLSEYGAGLRGAAFSVLIAIIAGVICFKRAGFERDTIADYNLDITSESTFAVILSMAAVLGLFSAGFLRSAGLTATPLPAGLLFVSALTGISLARGGAFIDGDSVVKCLFAAVLSPLLGALTCYSLCRIIDGDIVNTLIVLGLAGLVTGVVLYLQWQARNKLRKQIVRNREQQVYNTRKSLSALEVKAEMTEKDLLGKLEIKRKELVDFAVGVSDQKRFMEKFYDDLRSIRALPEGPERNAGLDRLLSTLRERMYFSREMNDFYARTEVLHKDFNMRLAEAYPNLTENERRLANLLRQGFSSKYIASLMNITPKSAEINRYRLRAKLGLKREDNLVQFIKSI